MREGWRRIGAMALGILALLGGAGALRPAPAWAQEPRPESGCKVGSTSILRCKIERTDERGASGQEARRCAGVYWVVGLSDRTDARDPAACYGVLTGLDCSGHIVGFRWGDSSVLCANINLAWSDYCELPLGSGLGGTGGACAWRDYYGTVIRLEVRVPPHRFRIAPYPVGFVAREDPWGVFHPTARLIWEELPWPQYADSGWRL